MQIEPRVGLEPPTAGATDEPALVALDVERQLVVVEEVVGTQVAAEEVAAVLALVAGQVVSAHGLVRALVAAVQPPRPAHVARHHQLKNTNGQRHN